MPTQIFPTITPQTIATGANANASVFNAALTPLNNFTSGIANIQSVDIVTVNTTLIQNRDVAIGMNATGGAKTVTLPAASGQRYPIFIKKVDASTNTVTISRAGSDTIEDPASPLLSPTATTFVLRQKDECVTLYPFGTTGWRVVNHYFPTNIYAGAFMTSGQPVTTGSFVIIQFNQDSTLPNGYDSHGFYNNSSYRFQPTIPGRYFVSATVSFAAGGACRGVAGIHVRDGLVKAGTEAGADTTNVFSSEVAHIVSLNGSNDYVDIRVYLNTNGRTTRPNADSTVVYQYYSPL